MNHNTVVLLMAAGIIAGPKGLSWALNKGRSRIARVFGLFVAAAGWGAVLGGLLFFWGG